MHEVTAAVKAVRAGDGMPPGRSPRGGAPSLLGMERVLAAVTPRMIRGLDGSRKWSEGTQAVDWLVSDGCASGVEPIKQRCVLSFILPSPDSKVAQEIRDPQIDQSTYSNC